jgi:uncharacterized protein YceH (UPF0502 family)
MIKKIGIICLALFVTLTVLSRHTLAQSSFALESRVSALEAENFQLRSQINRIESQLGSLGRQSPPDPIRVSAQAPSRANQQVSSSDPMFKRLATLVIELKERIQALEAQVAELKKQPR